jgi:hypothetical protein
MTAGQYNFTIEQNAKFSPVLTWRDATGALVNLTGFTATMKIWDRSTGQLITTLTQTPNANGDAVLLGGALGTINPYISTATTTSMNFSEASYKLRLNDSTSTHEGDRIIQGSISFSPEGA